MASENIEQIWNRGDAALMDAQLEIEVTEVHGVICGLAAGGCANDVSAFMPNLVNILNAGEQFGADVGQWLVELFGMVSEQFRGMETLDLPFEDRITSGQEAAYYLTMWAEAFLVGFGCSCGRQELSDSGRELVDEISEFARVEAEEVSSEEELEEILTTLTEHLKVCAMSLYADYGAVTGGRIPLEEGGTKTRGAIRDGELVIGEEGIHLSDLTG